LWRAAFACQKWWRLKFLGYDEAPNQQLIDFQPTDSGPTNRQSTNSDCTEGYGTNCECAQRKAAYCKRATCKRTQGLCAGARLSQITPGGVP
jgi:hypothetical protein